LKLISRLSVKFFFWSISLCILSIETEAKKAVKMDGS